MMSESQINKKFWKKLYKTGDTGWDVGTVTTPLKDYIDQLTDRSIKILVPGVGHGHEVEYLIDKGFTNVWAADLVKKPLKRLKKRCPALPESNLLNIDFFLIDDQFDLILEQTFFCALHPSLRDRYAIKTNELLRPNGKLVGLLFNFELTDEGPPFGGSIEAYEKLFQPMFTINTLSPCFNSITPRRDRELFCIFTKK